MYTPRFRNRNAYGTIVGERLEQYALLSGQNCGNTPSWSPYYQGSNTTAVRTIDTMDDVAGDPPNRKIGVAGYKFHPMTRVIAQELGGGAASWHSTLLATSCAGYPSAHNVKFRRLAQGDPGRAWSGLILPMINDRLDMERVPYPAAQVERLRALAETACLAKRGRAGETNLYESLMEADKTLGMLKDIINRARRIHNTLFFGTKGSTRLRTFTNETAGQYLATRYGFMPTLKDINATLVGLEKVRGAKLQTTRVKEVWEDQQTVQLTDQDDAATVNWARQYTIRQRLKVTAISLDQYELTLLGALGLGYKDFWSLPWELVSHSFVLDWFANIGDVISSFAPDIGFSNVGFCTVIEWECEETVSYSLRGLNAAKVTTQSLDSATPPPPFTRKIYRKERIVGPFTGGRLQWKTDFKFANPVRVLDALALLQASMSKVQRDLTPNPTDEIRRLRRRNPSQKGRRSVEDYRNLHD